MHIKHRHSRERLQVCNLFKSHTDEDGYSAAHSWLLMVVMCSLALIVCSQSRAAPLGLVAKPSTPRGLIHIEAENFVLNAYRVEDNANASGGKLISLRDPSAPQASPSEGTASTRFNGLSGTYTVVINYLDEADGTAQLRLKVAGADVDSWTLDQALGSGDPLTKFPFTARTIANVSLKNGDTVTLSGSKDASEHVRVDFIQFIHLASLRQAEKATLPPESIIKTNRPGITGTGYVDTIGEGFIEWAIVVPKAGDYTLEFRYSYALEGDPIRPLDISVNGNLVISKLQFKNTIVASRWLTEKTIVKLNSGSNTVRAATTGNGAADMDYLSVVPVKYLNANSDDVTPLQDPFKPEHGEPGYADTYYGRIDPDGTRKTLDGWKAVNGFSSPSNRIISASYINAFDLGFGREMHCKETGAGAPACYVDNYLNPKGESKLVATVAMETRKHPATQRQFTTFYAFDKDGKRINSAALDGEGPKSIPESCYACHMGYTNTGASPKTEHGGQFLPFDQNLYDNWPGKPTVAAQSKNIATLNALIWNWGKWFNGSIKDLIGGWYDAAFTTQFDENGNRTFNNDFNEGHMPGTWLTVGADATRAARERILYNDVYAKYCRTCHIAQGPWGVFTRDQDQRGVDWPKAIDFEKDAYNQICDPGVNQPIMPHAELTFDRFNNDRVIAGTGNITSFSAGKSTAREYLCSQPPPAPPVEPEGDVAAGKKTFETPTKLCTNCHKTSDVAGKDEPGGDLSCKASKLTQNLGSIDAQMNGLTLEEEEVDNLRAYFNSLCP